MQIFAREILARLLLAACLIVVAACGASAQDVVFRTYKDNSGFSCEFPSDWSFDEAKNSDRVFSGTEGEARDATIIIQVIDREKTAQKTAQAQLDRLKAQFLEVQDGRLITEGAAPIAGQQAPFAIVGYSTEDTAGKLRAFRHIQMVVTAPRSFLLMSYSAPDEIFDTHMRVFQNCSATLTIEAEAGKAPAAAPGPEGADELEEKAKAGAEKAPAPEGTDDTVVWRRNTDRAFWIAVPSVWSSVIDPAEPYSLDMRHPDRVEGVIVWALDLGKNTKVKDFAESWEQNLADKIFFMNERLAVPATEHPGVGVPKVPVIMREYQGKVSGATVQSVAAYVVYKKRGYTIVGYHFLADQEGEKRIRDAVMSFRLAAPDN